MALGTLGETQEPRSGSLAHVRVLVYWFITCDCSELG